MSWYELKIFLPNDNVRILEISCLVCGQSVHNNVRILDQIFVK